MTKPILRIALATPLRKLFEYLPPEGIDERSLLPGIRIQVPFQSRTLTGILIETAQKSTYPYEKLKSAKAILDTAPIFTADVYQLCLWAAEYYHYSLGEVLSAALPTLLRKGKPCKKKALLAEAQSQLSNTLLLNEYQQQAIDKIKTDIHQFKTFLLDGVTGSGKTEVYLRVIEEILLTGKQILVLIPEISLTPQTIERFRERFQIHIVALHSNLSDQDRLHAWMLAKSGEAKIVIGTRSAIFTPFKQLGLIIVDEEHDNSFKQQDRFRYHARDLAIKRASMNNIPIILGSATPSLESLLNVQRKRYDYLSLPLRAGKATLPQYQLLDLRNNVCEEGLCESLLTAMRSELTQNNQVMLFLNKRGFAPVLYCTDCQSIAECTRCDTRMVYHKSPSCLKCHHCESQKPLPKSCHQCGKRNLQPLGLGTQRLETTLQKYFPNVPIIRVDRDNTRRKGAMQNLLIEINTQPKAILLGTQMLAKGHHFPNVTLVGIVDADAGLFSVDFRAAEQMGQLLLQVAGRAGRADKPGVVMIQTRNPNNPLLQMLIKEGYGHFANHMLLERKQAFLPPFSYYALFRAEAYVEDQAELFLTKIKSILMENKNDLNILGPVSALIAKRKGLHCKHLLIKSNQRHHMQSILKIILQTIENFAMPSVKWILDVDPLDVI